MRAQDVKSYIFLLWDVLESLSVSPHAPGIHLYGFCIEIMYLFTRHKRETEPRYDPEGCHCHSKSLTQYSGTGSKTWACSAQAVSTDDFEDAGALEVVG